MSVVIEVEYWGQLRQAAGTVSDSIAFDSAPTIRELIARLTRASDDGFRALLLDSAGDPRSSLIVVVGDAQTPIDGDRRLENGVRVTLLSPIAGG
jgi:molybdopterin converting factor small subunit